MTKKFPGLLPSISLAKIEELIRAYSDYPGKKDVSRTRLLDGHKELNEDRASVISTWLFEIGVLETSRDKVGKRSKHLSKVGWGLAKALLKKDKTRDDKDYGICWRGIVLSSDVLRTWLDRFMDKRADITLLAERYTPEESRRTDIKTGIKTLVDIFKTAHLLEERNSRYVADRRTLTPDERKWLERTNQYGKANETKDAPNIIDAFILQIDPELRDRCMRQVILGTYDTAIRDAMILVETRLRELTSSSKYGVDLVNECFGSKGSLAPKFKDDAERQGFRDLFAGVMTVIRNDYAHNFRSPNEQETMTVIGLANMLLDKLASM